MEWYSSLRYMVTWPVVRQKVCKTLIHQFKSGRHLQRSPHAGAFASGMFGRAVPWRSFLRKMHHRQASADAPFSDSEIDKGRSRIWMPCHRREKRRQDLQREHLHPRCCPTAGWGHAPALKPLKRPPVEDFKAGRLDSLQSSPASRWAVDSNASVMVIENAKGHLHQLPPRRPAVGPQRPPNARGGGGQYHTHKGKIFAPPAHCWPPGAADPASSCRSCASHSAGDVYVL